MLPGMREAAVVSAEFVLWRTTVEALITVLSEKKGEQLLRAIQFVLADREALAEVRPLRQTEAQKQEARAVRAAAAAFRDAAPVLLARIDRG